MLRIIIGGLLDLPAGNHRGTGTRHGVPTIGGGIQMGDGAKILGSISIGDGALVGANAVVVIDVNPHTVVGGISAHILHQRGHGLEENDGDQ